MTAGHGIVWTLCRSSRFFGEQLRVMHRDVDDGPDFSAGGDSAAANLGNLYRTGEPSGHDNSP